MADRRETILKVEHRRGPDSITPEGYSQWVLNAMDSYMKECCLELITYMAKNITGLSIYKDDKVEFKFKGEWISKETLFESFL